MNSSIPLKDWAQEFAKKEVPVEEAIKLIRPGDRVFIDSGCSEPQTLMAQLVKKHWVLKDIEVIHFLSIARHGYIQDKPEDLFRHNAYFIGSEPLREAINAGHADYTPMHLSQIPAWFKGRKQLDVVLIQVSPPDKNGFCSFGVNVDVAKPLSESANLVIAEVNPRVPRTLGDSFIHAQKIDAFVRSENPLLESKYEHVPPVAAKIGKHVAKIVENGSTLQVGIGRYPHAVLDHLFDKKDLGVHTDSLFDGFLPLIEEGIITCGAKSFHRGKVVASYCMGTRRLFDFVDDNPLVEFHPSDYTNDPVNIARNDKMVSINGALSVDLTGQVNWDSLGTLFYGGVGGAVDFSRGAAMSKGGKPIILLPSTARDGTISRIIPYMGKGDRVSLTMADVHYVVTEFGIAYLHGKSVRDRVLAMINIAHPKFRSELLEAAKDLKYIYQDQLLPVNQAGEIVIYPAQYEARFVTRDGREVFFRPVKPTDERLVQELYYSLDDESRVFRFFMKKKYFGHADVQPNVNIDYESIMALIGISGDPHSHDQEAVALCSYLVDRDTNMGEIAFTVRKGWREQGLTKYMLSRLIRIAREKGLTGFKGDIHWENKPMAHIIKTCGYVIRGSRVGEDWVFNFRFDERT